MKILVVDNEESIREVFKLGLEYFRGYEVYMAADGQEALKIVQEINPDAIISDYSMPDISGLELFKIIKERFPRFPETAFILISGEDLDCEEINRQGILSFFLKPVSLWNLFEAVEKVPKLH